jgi:hypothetical protein
LAEIPSAEVEIKTTLHPGWNLVGWIHADAAVSGLFEQIPKLTSISDGSGSRVERGLTDQPDALNLLRSGEGYWFHVDSDSPVIWQRSGVQTAGANRIPSGQSLAAWIGGNNVPVGLALESLGDNLIIAWRWNAAEQQFLPWAPSVYSPYVDSLPLRRGDALLVNLQTPMTWYQRYLDSPHFDIAADVPESVHRDMVVEITSVVESLNGEFDTYPAMDQLRFVIVTAAGDIREHSDSLVPQDNSPGTYRIEVSALWWDPNLYPQDDATREMRWQKLSAVYYGVLLPHLLGDVFNQLPEWLRLSGPTWQLWGKLDEVGYELGDIAHLAAQHKLRDEVELLFPAPEEIEDRPEIARPQIWFYAIATVAAAFLHEAHGPEPLIRFWTALAESTNESTSWRDTFERVFGQSIEDFYFEYNQRLRAQYPIVEGRIDAPGWIRLDQLSLAYRNTSTGLSDNVPVSSNGEFRTAVPANTEVQFSVSLPRLLCRGYSTAQGQFISSENDSSIAVGSEGSRDLTLTIPDDFCSTSIRGRVTDFSGEPVKNLSVVACTAGKPCASTLTDNDGRFYILTNLETDYYLGLRDKRARCTVFYRNRAITLSADMRTVFSGGPSTSETVRIRIPPSLCWGEISGVLHGLSADAPRMPMLGIPNNFLRARAISTVDRSVYDANITADGRITIPVPADASYHVRFEPRIRSTDLAQQSCVWEHRQVVELDGRQRLAVRFDLPDDFCRWQVAGQVVDESGEAIAHVPVRACHFGSGSDFWSCGPSVTANAQGEFSMFIPYDGAFFIAPSSGMQCGPVATDLHQLHLTMDGRNIAGVELRLPHDLCSES